MNLWRTYIERIDIMKTSKWEISSDAVNHYILAQFVRIRDVVLNYFMGIEMFSLNFIDISLTLTDIYHIKSKRGAEINILYTHTEYGIKTELWRYESIFGKTLILITNICVKFRYDNLIELTKGNSNNPVGLKITLYSKWA